MKLLTFCDKSRYMIVAEEFEINTSLQFNRDNALKDKLSYYSNIIFDPVLIIIDKRTIREEVTYDKYFKGGGGWNS